MFINIKILTKNQNSLKKFLDLFNCFCLKNSKNKDSYIIKKKLTKIIKTKWPNKSKILLPLLSNFKIHIYKKTYKCKIVKKKYTIKRKVNGLLNYSQQKKKTKNFYNIEITTRQQNGTRANRV